MAIVIKSPEEIRIMRKAGQITATALDKMREAVRPGVSTWELDAIARDVLREHGAEPAFLGYPPGGPHPFPATITASVNEELVHGIPRKDAVLEEGDILSIDFGVIYEGFVGDSAITVPVGEVSEPVRRLLEVTEAALYEGIAASRAGSRVGDVSAAIQKYVESHGYSVPREYTGHGVGREMHEEPQVPNWGRPGRGPALRPGMTYALEPMVIAGRPKMRVLDDHWTVVPASGALTAHFEHTIAITEGDAEILTLL